MSSTAQMWFLLSKAACLIISHDAEGENKFFELLAETVERALPPIREREARQSLVEGVNRQTITNADRFVFSPPPPIKKSDQGSSRRGPAPPPGPK